MAGFSITPRGPFALEHAIAFQERWPASTSAETGDGVLRTAFVTDDMQGRVGVAVRQDADGEVHGTIHGPGAAPGEAVRDQVARILGLDVDATGWRRVGDADPVLGRMMDARPGFRPVAFASPYEAAVWSVLSARVPAAVARRLRERLAEACGAVVEVDGVPLAACPAPAELRAVDAVDGIPAEKLLRLHGIADAAAGGGLDAATLRAAPPEEVLERLQGLRGIGPFFASLILVRGLPAVDVAATEPRLAKLIAAEWGVSGEAGVAAVMDGWAPFRTWGCVLVRSAG